MTLTLNPAQLPVVQLVDGRRTIGQVIDGVAQREGAGPEDKARRADFGLTLFRSL